MVDLGVLGATQIDQFGNINSTMLGLDFKHPEKRFPGSGGANEVLTQCWRTVIVIMHERRRFVKKVDFVTSPGYLDGTPGARERAGLPKGTGPWRVVTSKALYGFDGRSNRMTLLGVLRGISDTEVLKEMDFEPLIGEEVEQLDPPSPEELRVLRQEIDPDRAIIGKTARY
jgi:glutaconate CoA-transferase subunit B